MRAVDMQGLACKRAITSPLCGPCANARSVLATCRPASPAPPPPPPLASPALTVPRWPAPCRARSLRCAVGPSPGPAGPTPSSPDGASSSTNSSSTNSTNNGSANSSGSGAGAAQEDPLSLEAAAATLDVIWGLARRRQVDELLRYFPDSVVDGADELRSAAE